MKNLCSFLIALTILVSLTASAQAQNAADTTSLRFKVVKQNGVSFSGKILSQNAREILMETAELGLVYIPKHEVREIMTITSNGKNNAGELFSTRYFLTTNGFPVEKGDNYVQWNLFGPDFQFGIADNFGVGIMTSWVGMPVIGTAKYSFKIAENFHGGLGFLGGTGSWAFPKYGLVLPFGFLTVGNRVNNINISAGYGAVFAERTEEVYTLIDKPTDYSTNSFTSVGTTSNDAEGRVLLSLAGTFRLNKKFSFVFDSFIMLPGKATTEQILKETYNQTGKGVTYSLEMITRKRNPLIVLAPGIRFQATENSSFQFGFTGVHFEGEFIQVPIPLVQWFIRI
jgi:hypothetical protein